MLDSFDTIQKNWRLIPLFEEAVVYMGYDVVRGIIEDTLSELVYMAIHGGFDVVKACTA